VTVTCYMESRLLGNSPALEITLTHRKYFMFLNSSNAWN